MKKCLVVFVSILCLFFACFSVKPCEITLDNKQFVITPIGNTYCIDDVVGFQVGDDDDIPPHYCVFAIYKPNLNKKIIAGIYFRTIIEGPRLEKSEAEDIRNIVVDQWKAGQKTIDLRKKKD